MSNSQQEVSIRGLTRMFDGAVALDGVDLDIQQGEVIAVLGA